MATTLEHSLRSDRISGLKLRPVCNIRPDAPVNEVVQCMVEQRTGCALVSGPGGLVGIFTERDFLSRVVAPRLDVGVAVETVMTPAPKTVSVRDSVHAAIELMESGGYRHLPVLGEDGVPVGVLSVKDVVHYLVEYFPANIYNLPPTLEQTQPAREGA